MPPIRTLIVDDEALARRGLRTLLRDDPEVEVVGECRDGREAVAAIRERRPELVYLDVQMPALDGFAVIDAVGVEAMPAVVFVTAYDEHALRAFEVHALDYLLKPFDRDRFARSLDRAKRLVRAAAPAPSSGDLAALLRDLRAAPPAPPRYAERLLVKHDGRIYFVPAADVDWVEAAGNYLRIHAGAERHLLHETMNALEERLDPARFVRVHRSAIVNVDRIREIQPWFHGGLVIILKTGARVTASRTYKDRLLSLGHSGS
ncbi:MAG TPA: LytTR family transcriptional regulator DNA-binding domain-containing protein [Gemmatimonadaceae bacterium]|nr:LytTR family transcriptional regulator DNA-binding domain-containing protein [Gemmatimonadaceae bacterium]